MIAVPGASLVAVTPSGLHATPVAVEASPAGFA
jgi:hypothetical protein